MDGDEMRDRRRPITQCNAAQRTRSIWSGCTQTFVLLHIRRFRLSCTRIIRSLWWSIGIPRSWAALIWLGDDMTRTNILLWTQTESTGGAWITVCQSIHGVGVRYFTRKMRFSLSLDNPHVQPPGEFYNIDNSEEDFIDRTQHPRMAWYASNAIWHLCSNEAQ